MALLLAHTIICLDLVLLALVGLGVSSAGRAVFSEERRSEKGSQDHGEHPKEEISDDDDL